MDNSKDITVTMGDPLHRSYTTAVRRVFVLRMAEIGDAIITALEHRITTMQAELKAAGIT
jgi:hypothetical protein